jgi:hypothetical protein
MLSGVLKSAKAVQVSIQIINALKDLGKKWFAFSKFDKDAFTLLERLVHEAVL